jgi:hypothetical protein
MVNLKNSILLLAVLLGSGCSDYNLSRVVEAEDVDFYPEIEVSPEHLDFGILNADGEVKSLDVTIKNIGNESLILNDAYLNNQSSIYSITNLSVAKLEPYEETTITVTYDPITYEGNNDRISIFSNDEDETESIVTISGAGSAPVIVIDPSQYSFGDIDIGCDSIVTVTISNIGDVDLEINDIEFLASLPVDFSLEDQTSINSSLPIIIAPGDNISADVSYRPLDLLDDNSYIEVSSNDPLSPVAYTTQEGYGKYYNIVTDSHEQDGMLESDILFVIDNSGSMGRNQTSLANNFDSFINIFSASGVDYRIGFITTDNGSEFVDGITVTNLSPDPVSEVNSIISSIGTHGSAMERGLYESYLATTSGGPADPYGTFMRSSAKFVVIYISDEPDHSSSYSTFTASDYSAHLNSLKGSSSLISAHAVAGDYPSGCTGGGTYATFGDGYYDVVSDLGGTFVSMCSTDWGTQLEELARDSIASNLFSLTQEPIYGSIYVEVNGAASTTWVYEPTTNSITFLSDIPEDGDIIDIEYAIYGCE